MTEKFETKAIRTQLERTPFQEHSVPLYLTSSFVFEDAEDMRASFADRNWICFCYRNGCSIFNLCRFTP